MGKTRVGAFGPAKSRVLAKKALLPHVEPLIAGRKEKGQRHSKGDWWVQ